MRVLFLVVFSAWLAISQSSASSFSAFEASRQGEYKGWRELSRDLSSRLFESPYHFSFGQYLNDDDGLLALLGDYARIGVSSRFQNGKPNGLNLLLYAFVIQSLSHDWAGLCDGASVTPSLNMGALLTLQKYCDWPKKHDYSEPDDHLMDLWTLLVGFDLPDTEYLAWRDFFWKNRTELTGKAALQAMIKSALLNPYFLLEN